MLLAMSAQAMAQQVPLGPFDYSAAFTAPGGNPLLNGYSTGLQTSIADQQALIRLRQQQQQIQLQQQQIQMQQLQLLQQRQMQLSPYNKF